MQPHPAPFSKVILDRLREMLAEEEGVRALDPFGGTGRVLCALPSGSAATIIEIEESYVIEGMDWLQELAPHPGRMLKAHYDVPGYARPVKYEWIIGDSRKVLRRRKGTYNWLITSPTYGNRFSDGYRAKEGTVCRSYAQSKGGPLEKANTGRFKFMSPEYQTLNAEVMAAAIERMEPGGNILINVSDFYRTAKKGEQPKRVGVVAWWIELMSDLGCPLYSAEPVKTRRFKKGENRHRVDYEMILWFKKES